MDKATPSSEILPERRICSGTCPSKSNVSVVFCFGKIAFANVTSKIVPTTFVVAVTPSCLKLAMFKYPISFGFNVLILLSFTSLPSFLKVRTMRLSGSEIACKRASISLPG